MMVGNSPKRVTGRGGLTCLSILILIFSSSRLRGQVKVTSRGGLSRLPVEVVDNFLVKLTWMKMKYNKAVYFDASKHQ